MNNVYTFGDPSFSLRPWGYFQIVGKGERFKVKLLTIYPGHRLSVQRHMYRTEVWQAISGKGEIFLSDGGYNNGKIESGKEVYIIPPMMIHSVINNGDENLVIVEIQTGEKVDEDDIERIQDFYNRT